LCFSPRFGLGHMFQEAQFQQWDTAEKFSRFGGETSAIYSGGQTRGLPAVVPSTLPGARLPAYLTESINCWLRLITLP